MKLATRTKISSTPVQTIAARDVTPEVCAAIFDLLRLVWPPLSDDSIDIAAELNSWRNQPTIHFVIRDENSGRIHAHALIFARAMFTDDGPIRVGALGGVCVHPDYRGRGWGAAVARAAFEFLPQLNVEVSMFQTPVPEFYAKLGCREINNAFFDGTRADGVKTNPFSDAWQMIYPASFAWPDGEVDLNGPEY